jgi:F-type H+-transporting ATPase subunit a
MQTRDLRTTTTVLALLLMVALAATALAAPQQGHADGEGQDEPLPGTPRETAEAALEQAHGEHAANADDHGDDHGGGGFHLDNIYKLLVKNLVPLAMGDDADPKEVKKTADALYAWREVFFSFIVIIVLAAFFISVSRDLRERDPTRRQMFVEAILGGLYNMFEQVLGKDARRFAPFLGTLFLFIILNNWFGLIPLGFSSTSSLANTTLGLGLLTFLYVQYTGIRANGLGGYLHHFAGQPRSPVEWVFAILIFPLEVVGEIIKPISLSLRLFGNIYGEETLIAVMVMLSAQFMGFLLGQFGDPGATIAGFMPGIPFQFPFYFIVLIASTVQALVFTLLSTVYISLMLPHHDEEEAH